MNKIEKFENLRVWQEAMLLVSALRSEYKGGNPSDFIDQMQHYAFGIPTLIAEGYAKKTTIEFIQSLCAAIYICTKLTAYLHSALEVNIIDKTYQRIQLGKIRKISQMLNSLIKIHSAGGIPLKKSALRKSMTSEIFFV
jgi:four helix bundle protein